MSRREAAKEGGQLGFALLLGFCLFQTVWWVYDSRVYSIEVRARAQRPWSTTSSRPSAC